MSYFPRIDEGVWKDTVVISVWALFYHYLDIDTTPVTVVVILSTINFDDTVIVTANSTRWRRQSIVRGVEHHGGLVKSTLSPQRNCFCAILLVIANKPTVQLEYPHTYHRSSAIRLLPLLLIPFDVLHNAAWTGNGLCPRNQDDSRKMMVRFFASLNQLQSLVRVARTQCIWPLKVSSGQKINCLPLLIAFSQSSLPWAEAALRFFFHIHGFLFFPSFAQRSRFIVIMWADTPHWVKPANLSTCNAAPC